MHPSIILLFILTILYLIIGFSLFKYHQHQSNQKQVNVFSKQTVILGFITNGIMFLIYETEYKVIFSGILLILILFMIFNNFKKTTSIIDSIIMTIAQMLVLTVILFMGPIFYDNHQYTLE